MKKRLIILITVLAVVLAGGVSFYLYKTGKVEYRADTTPTGTTTTDITFKNDTTQFKFDPQVLSINSDNTLTLRKPNDTRTQMLTPQTKYGGMRWQACKITPSICTINLSDYVTFVNDGNPITDPLAPFDISSDNTYVQTGLVGAQIWFQVSQPTNIPDNAIPGSIKLNPGPRFLPGATGYAVPALGVNCNLTVTPFTCTSNPLPNPLTRDFLNNLANKLYIGFFATDAADDPFRGPKISRIAPYISYEIPGNVYKTPGTIELQNTPEHQNLINSQTLQSKWTGITINGIDTIKHKIPTNTSVELKVCAGDGDRTTLTLSSCAAKTLTPTTGVLNTVNFDTPAVGQYAKFYLTLNSNLPDKTATPVMPASYTLNFLPPGAYSTDGYVWTGAGPDFVDPANPNGPIYGEWSDPANWLKPAGSDINSVPSWYPPYLLTGREGKVSFLGTQNNKYPKGDKNVLVANNGEPGFLEEMAVPDLFIDGYNGTIRLKAKQTLIVKNFTQKSGFVYASEGGFYVYNFTQEGGRFDAPLGSCGDAAKYGCLRLMAKDGIVKDPKWTVGPNAVFNPASGQATIVADFSHTRTFDISPNPQKNTDNPDNAFRDLVVIKPKLDTVDVPVSVNLKTILTRGIVANNQFKLTNNSTTGLVISDAEATEAKTNDLIFNGDGSGKISFGNKVSVPYVKVRRNFENKIDMYNLDFKADIEFIDNSQDSHIFDQTYFEGDFKVLTKKKTLVFDSQKMNIITGKFKIQPENVSSEADYVTLKGSGSPLPGTCPVDDQPYSFQFQGGTVTLNHNTQWAFSTPKPANSTVQHAKISDSFYMAPTTNDTNNNGTLDSPDETSFIAIYSKRGCKNENWEISAGAQ